MAYQNVVTPVFYCNVIEWLMSNGAIDLSAEGYNEQLYRTLPVSPTGFITDWNYNLNVKGMTENSFIAVLGHTFDTEKHYHVIYGSDELPIGSYTEVINATSWGTADWAGYDGFSIARFNNGTDNISAFAYKSGDLIIAENALTGEKRIVGQTAMLSEVNRRVLKG